MPYGLRSLAVVIVCLGMLRWVRGADGDETRAKFDKAMAKVFPALVQIYVVTVDYRDGREQKYQAAGSGVIISSAGHVITNHHVAGKAKRIRCTLVQPSSSSSRDAIVATPHVGCRRRRRLTCDSVLAHT